MFRDSRGVVHTVCSADPLDDLPLAAARALQDALLRPVDGDVGNALERCDAVRDLVERWQDAFFTSLPAQFDAQEERRWAIQAGVSLDEIEEQYVEDEDDELPPELDDPDDLVDLLGTQSLLGDDEDLRVVLPDQLVSMLERELLLLPVRTRLEALVAATDLVESWSELLADDEKLLGHLILRHGGGPLAMDQEPLDHEAMADRHAELHTGTGPGHAR
ncbi:MAG: hypothetical protein NVS3B26_13170 [Mycobacteriales bacterium]